MGKIWSMITIGLLLSFLIFPVLGGVPIVRGFSAEEVGRFAHDVLQYWVKVGRIVFF